MKTIHDLIAIMQYYGLNVNYQNIKTTGKITRCPTKRKPSSKNGWYICFINSDFINAVFGDYQLNMKQSWCNKAKLNLIEKKLLHTQYVETVKESENIRLNYLNRIRYLYKKNIRPLNVSHPYIENKKISKLIQLAISDKIGVDKYNNLIIPVRNINSDLMGFQTINESGAKRFAKGTYKHGNFYNIIPQGLSISGCDLVLIGEGFASLASVYISLNHNNDACNYCAIVAFDVGNIEPVLINIWNRYGNKEIVLIADNDCGNDTNVGLNTCNDIKSKFPHRLITVIPPKDPAYD